MIVTEIKEFKTDFLTWLKVVPSLNTHGAYLTRKNEMIVKNGTVRYKTNASND